MTAYASGGFSKDYRVNPKIEDLEPVVYDKRFADGQFEIAARRGPTSTQRAWPTGTGMRLRGG